MLPDPKHVPPARPQQRADLTIPNTVSIQLRCPELGILRRHLAVPRTSVPEATVDEDRHPCPPKHEVGAPGQSLVTAPPGDAMTPKENYQGQFRGAIPTSGDPRHHF